MRIVPLNEQFTVCQLDRETELDLEKEFYFVGKTRDEISLVCQTRDVPQNTLQREDGWRGFFVDGTLDFSLIGILAHISSLLAAEGISIFALSTFNTDYVLVKEQHFEKALSVLSEHGYTLVK